MRRREFIKVIAGSTVTWPLATYAQQSALPIIGFLSGCRLGHSRSALLHSVKD